MPPRWGCCRCAPCRRCPQPTRCSVPRWRVPSSGPRRSATGVTSTRSATTRPAIAMIAERHGGDDDRRVRYRRRATAGSPQPALTRTIAASTAWPTTDRVRHSNAPADRQAGGDRRSQRDRVVRVDRALHVAEGGGRHEQPAAPHDQAGASRVGAAAGARSARSRQPAAISAAGSSQEISRPNSPRNSRLQAGCAAEAGVPAARSGAAAAAVAARRRTADPGRCSRRPAAAGCCRCCRRCRAGPAAGQSGNGGDPPTGRDAPWRPARPRELGDAPPHGRPGPRPGRRAPKAGTGSSAWPLLVRNAKPTAAPASSSQRVPGRLERAGHAVRRGHQEQHEQGVRVVEAEDQRGGRGQGQHRAGEQPGARARDPAYRGDQQRRPRRRPRAPAAPAGSSCCSRRSAPTGPSPTARPVACRR